MSQQLNATPRVGNLTRWNSETETLIKKRVSHIKLPIAFDCSPEIINEIKDYVHYGRTSTEHMLGRSELYFPIFEHNLVINHLPKELMYLPMVESELRPYITSPKNASGLWQFVPSTARAYGIRISQMIDERRDPYRSTEAAVKYLSHLYYEYCDWSLVLAAYNCGTVRVNKAIRLAGSSEYDKVAPYLPMETQSYLQKFVAAAYVANFYHEHGLKVNEKFKGFDEIRTIKIDREISFETIEEITGISPNVIYRLNPSYLWAHIPQAHTGNYLTLPADALKKVVEFLRKTEKSTVALYKPDSAFEKQYRVKVGENLTEIASRFGCQEKEIMAWNGLKSTKIHANQHLYLYFRPEVRWNIS